MIIIRQSTLTYIFE